MNLDPTFFRSFAFAPYDNSNDPINPSHYMTDGSSIECIDITEGFPFCLGNAIKYAWRAGQKDNLFQDLEKCQWYLNRALANGDMVCYRNSTRELERATYAFSLLSKENFYTELNYLLVGYIVRGEVNQANALVNEFLKDVRGNDVHH